MAGYRFGLLLLSRQSKTKNTKQGYMDKAQKVGQNLTKQKGPQW